MKVVCRGTCVRRLIMKCLKEKTAENIFKRSHFPSPMLSGTSGTVSFHISLESLSVAESFTRLFLSSLWVPVSTRMDLWWFWRLVAALRTCRRSFASQRLHAWPPLILFIYIHRHLRRKPLGLVHADSERDSHRVINSCSHLSRWGAFQEFSGTRCGWERWPH